MTPDNPTHGGIKPQEAVLNGVESGQKRVGDKVLSRQCPKKGGTDASRAALQSRCEKQSELTLDHHLLDLGDRLRRVESLRAGLGAVHDGVAAIEAERILEIVEPFSSGLVAAVD